MAITLPTPLRVAAGIVASGIDLVRSLPEEIPALPVTLVGKAMQLSMKVQQEIADLATKGDELLSGVLGGPQENPPWAQFDDDPPPSTAVSAGSRQKDSAGPARPGGAGSARAGVARAGTAAGATGATVRVAEGGKAPVVTPLARSTPPGVDAAGGKAEAKTKQGKKSKDSKPKQDKAEGDQKKAPGLVHPSADTAASAAAAAAAADGAPESPAPEATESEAPAPEATAPEAAEPTAPEPEATEPTAGDNGDTDGTPAEPDAVSANEGAPASAPEETDTPAETDKTAETDRTTEADAIAVADDGPFALPDYDRMTLAQVRGYLRSLSAQEVQSLLDHEQSGENRAPFLTLLSNRLVTLEHQES